MKRLGELCEINPSKTTARRTLTGGQLVSFIPMNDVGVLTKIVRTEQEKPLKDVIGSYTYFADDDVLLAKITPCFENGKLGIVRGLTNGIGFGSSEFLVLRSRGELDPEFLFYFLAQDTFRDNGARRMTGAVGHKRIPKEFVEEHPLCLPSLAEQKRIVAILDEAFGGIDAAVANAKRNIANARELFDSSLNAVFSQTNESWVEQKLSSVCNKITVGHVGPMIGEYRESGIPFLRSKNIRPFNIALDDVVFIDEGFNTSLQKSALSPGDLVIVRTGYPGTAAVIPNDLPRANCSDLVIFRPGKQIDAHYLAMFFNSAYGKRMVGGNLNGAAQKHFNVTAAKEVSIRIPPLLEQNRLVTKLHQLREQTSSLEQHYAERRRILADLKQSILQKAFAGELTAKEAEREFAAT